MMIQIPGVLSREQVRQCRRALEAADWTDGRETAGHVAVHHKNNAQLALDHPLASQIGDLVLDALSRSPAFISAVLPVRVLPPRFNRYEGGGDYGNHIDNALLNVPGSGMRIRTDVSSTLFFSDPYEYDGGELTVEDTYGEHTAKLPAGDLVLYPGTSLHRVTPVTRGTRYAAFFWTQSMVRQASRRALLYQLDQSIQALIASSPEHPSVSRLTGIYHNLLREWVES
ncbi:MAG: Fe2+-dependent dioxygenase [Pigmentiphaga sp.]|nr:Fe2+-dependent dioxygenase [Pigmentiphaga sp.]